MTPATNRRWLARALNQAALFHGFPCVVDVYEVRSEWGGPDIDDIIRVATFDLVDLNALTVPMGFAVTFSEGLLRCEGVVAPDLTRDDP